MSDDGSGLAERVRRAARAAGRRYAETRRAYREGRVEGDPDLPRDEAGRARIVCRRHAERRAVALEGGRPACYDGDHPDCRGCAEDVRAGRVETWTESDRGGGTGAEQRG